MNKVEQCAGNKFNYHIYLSKLFYYYSIAFLDKEVNELCEILDDHKITEDRDFPEEFWNRCKKQGFFGMIIPKQYGGKGKYAT